MKMEIRKSGTKRLKFGEGGWQHASEVNEKEDSDLNDRWRASEYRIEVEESLARIPFVNSVKERRSGRWDCIMHVTPIFSCQVDLRGFTGSERNYGDE